MMASKNQTHIVSVLTYNKHINVRTHTYGEYEQKCKHTSSSIELTLVIMINHKLWVHAISSLKCMPFKGSQFHICPKLNAATSKSFSLFSWFV